MNQTRYRYSKVRVLLLIIFLLLLISSLTYGGLKVYERFFSADNATYRTKNISSEDIVSLVSKLAQVPEGEIPIVSTITDTTNLKSQPFFKDALVGDRVVIYHKAKMAYLFRPTIGKLISIAPLSD